MLPILNIMLILYNKNKNNLFQFSALPVNSSLFTLILEWRHEHVEEELSVSVCNPVIWNTQECSSDDITSPLHPFFPSKKAHMSAQCVRLLDEFFLSFSISLSVKLSISFFTLPFHPLTTDNMYNTTTSFLCSCTFSIFLLLSSQPSQHGAQSCVTRENF